MFLRCEETIFSELEQGLLKIAQIELIKDAGNTPNGTKFVIDGSLKTPKGAMIGIKYDSRIRYFVLSRDFSEYGLTRGDVGAVVHVYGDGKTYEVEFVTGEGKTVAVVIFTKANIRPMRREEILHVRNDAVAG